MSGQKRREIMGAVAALLTSGCISDDESYMKIQEIEVVNLREEDVEVTIVAKRNNEIIYESTFEFKAIQGGSTDGVNLDEDWMRAEEDLEVTISAVSIDETAFSTADLSQDYGNTDCISTFCTVDTNGINVYYSRTEC
ncbi:hypothetical protein [Halorubrum sp. FL23]|uniref:hypothetical protein n=1 Tax=Halorubrum sp. FL23 TaxID=3458704 RepID=UPI004033E3FB